MAHQNTKRRAVAAFAGIVAVSISAAACGGGSSSSGGGGSAGAGSRGPITFVQGKDNSGVLAPMAAAWNKAHPTEKVTTKEQSDQADAQHADLVQNFQAKTSAYDVVAVDVIWTAEFAAKGWLVPLKGQYALPTSGLLPATVKAATYNNTLYAAPTSSDGGLLYYRKDLVPTPPKTLDEMWKDCSIAKKKGIDCYAGQFAKYEGLTVNVSEAINTFGGKIVDDQGKAAVDSAQAKQGLGMLAEHYKNGDIPKQAITYQEEQGRQSFEDGKLLFLRNWPYVYNLAKTDGSSKVKNTFGVAPLPGVGGGPGASSLGGHQAAISVYSNHKATAIDFLKFLESDQIQTMNMEKGSLAPVTSAIYKNQSLVSKYPYLPTLLTSIENAVPRPVTPFYPAVTTAIQDNAYAAIKGSKSVDQALKDMQSAINAAGS